MTNPVVKKVANFRNIFSFMYKEIAKFFQKRTFAYPQIEKINQCICIDGVLINPVPRELFQKYLLLDEETDKKTLLRLQCFSVCETILKQTCLMTETELRENLFDTCPTYAWVERLELEFHDYDMNTNKFGVYRALIELRNESILEIEISEIYSRFREETSMNSEHIVELLVDIHDNL